MRMSKRRRRDRGLSAIVKVPSRLCFLLIAGAACDRDGHIPETGKRRSKLTWAPPRSLNIATAAAGWQYVDTANTASPREEGNFVMVNGKGYALGGRGNVTVDVYQPSSQTWTRLSRMPTELHHFQPVVVDNRFIYLVTSWTGPFPKEKAVSFIYIYDTVRDTWSTRPGLPSDRNRGSTTAVLFQREIYVSHGNIGGHGASGREYNWLDKYHIDQNQWTTNLADAPNARDHAGAVLIRDETSRDPMFCVAAGRLSGSRNYRDLTVLPTDCYHIKTNSWTVHANVTGQGRAGAAYGRTCDGKRMIVAGGEGFGKAWRNVDVFDGTSWTAWPSMRQARQGTGLAISCSCANNVYIVAGGVGGQGGTPLLNTTEQYRPVDQAVCPSAAPSRSPSIAPSPYLPIFTAIRLFNVNSRQEMTSSVVVSSGSSSLQGSSSNLVTTWMLFLDQVGYNLTVRADTRPTQRGISYIKFQYDVKKYLSTDHVAPYWMGGDQSDVNKAVPAISTLGVHKLRIQAYGGTSRLVMETRDLTVIVEPSIVAGFTLLDLSRTTAGGSPLEVMPLNNGTVVSLSAVGSTRLDVRVDLSVHTKAGTVQCVKIRLDQDILDPVWRAGDCQAPYTIRSSNPWASSLPFLALTAFPGQHSLVALALNAAGRVVGQNQINFSVVR